MLVGAIIFITMAFICYTIGVWSEKIQGELKKKHLVFFWLGLCFDTLGTSLMSRLAAGGEGNVFHEITGGLAIILMLIHAIWATYVLVKGKEETKVKFHQFSLVVWCIWLIPFLSGMMMGMMG